MWFETIVPFSVDTSTTTTSTLAHLCHWFYNHSVHCWHSFPQLVTRWLRPLQFYPLLRVHHHHHHGNCNRSHNCHVYSSSALIWCVHCESCAHLLHRVGRPLITSDASIVPTSHLWLPSCQPRTMLASLWGRIGRCQALRLSLWAFPRPPAAMCARADTGVVSLVSQSVSGHFLLMRTRGRRFRPPTSIIHSLHLYLSLHLLLLAAALSAITSSTIDKGIPSDARATSSRPSANFHHLFASSLVSPSSQSISLQPSSSWFTTFI